MIPTTARAITAVEYTALVERVCAAIRAEVPPEGQVAVVTRGDARFLDLGERRAMHFPQHPGGGYAGYHPADSQEAVNHLEELRVGGATHLVVPQTSFWWFGHYAQLREHLVRHHSLVAQLDDTCVIFRLDGAPQWRASRKGGSVSGHSEHLTGLMESLLPSEAAVAIAGSAGLEPADRRCVSFPALSAGASDLSVSRLVREVEALREQGVSFLIILSDDVEGVTSDPELAGHIRRTHQLVTRQEHVCEIYEIMPSDPGGEADLV